MRGSGRAKGMLSRVSSVTAMCRMYGEAVSSVPGRRKWASMDLIFAFNSRGTSGVKKDKDDNPVPAVKTEDVKPEPTNADPVLLYANEDEEYVEEVMAEGTSPGENEEEAAADSAAGDCSQSDDNGEDAKEGEAAEEAEGEDGNRFYEKKKNKKQKLGLGNALSSC